MEETFYSFLDVDADADGETIRRAYRSMVKECHPDVSDDPAAPERFKRLTTARDVLLDDAERARYNRLGHDAYVRQHVESSVWTADAATAGATESATSAGPHKSAGRSRTGERERTERGRTGERRRAGRGRASTGRSPGRAAWLGDDRRRTDRIGRQDRHTKASHATGAPGGRDWQQASRVYRRVETDIEEGATVIDDVVEGVRAVGPWISVHVVLILSALVTGWFTFVQASRTLELSVPVVAFGVLAIGVLVFLSLVHTMSQLYA